MRLAESCWLMQTLLLYALQIQFKFLLAEQLDPISLELPLALNGIDSISEDGKSHIKKRGAGCIFEPEITPEGSEQFGTRIVPLRSKPGPSYLQPAASTYQATQYRPAPYNLPPALSSNDHDVNNINYPPYNQYKKTTINPFSVSNYKATTPKYSSTTPKPTDEVEPAGSGDVFDAIKPSTVGPEYLPPETGEKRGESLSATNFVNTVSEVPSTPQPIRSFNLVNQVPFQHFNQRLVQNVPMTISGQSSMQLVQSNNDFPLKEAASNTNALQEPYYRPVSLSIKNPSPNGPIIREDLKNYLPPENAAPSEENPSFIRPAPAKTTTTERPSLNEYLPPEKSSESTNDNPTFLRPVPLRKPENGLTNQFTTPDEHYHTLEELCNDPFHSFLCVQLKPRSKDRFKNRNSKKSGLQNSPYSSFTQPRVVSQKSVIPILIKPTEADALVAPAASFQNIARVKLPEEKPNQSSDQKTALSPASSINQLSILKSPDASYLPPAFTTLPPAPVTSGKAPAGLYAKDPFSELIFVDPVKPTPSVKPSVIPRTYYVPQVQAKNILPQPSNNQFQFAPRQFPSTVKPTTVTEEKCQEHRQQLPEFPITSSASEEVRGYNYPQPSAASTLLSGYHYPHPAPLSVSSSVYNSPQTTTEQNEIPSASNRETFATAYSVPESDRKSQQSISQITSYQSVKPTIVTTSTQPIAPTTPKLTDILLPNMNLFYQSPSSLSPKKFDTTSLLKPNDFNFLPSELYEISKFRGGASSSLKSTPSINSQYNQQLSGFTLPLSTKNNTSSILAADTSLSYSYPVPSSASPAETNNFENFNGYFYPKPSNNVPTFETTSKPDSVSGYDYPAPSTGKRFFLPSDLPFQSI